MQENQPLCAVRTVKTGLTVQRPKARTNPSLDQRDSCYLMSSATSGVVLGRQFK